MHVCSYTKFCPVSKGKCQRRDPPCKYFHPPHHLREQLLQNGRNNLIMKSMQLQLLHQQLLVQGAAMLPLSAASPSPASAAAAAAAAVASVSNPNGQCAAPSGSPVSSAAPLTSAGKLLYPTAPPMNLANHGMASTYSLLSVSDPSQMSVDATSVMGTADQQTGSLAKPSGQKTEEESSQATSFYPETYIEAPPYGYP
nr:unnamed protein product [Spirometra erinaceieuropaei]